MLEINKKLFNNLNEDNINYLVYKGLSHLEDDLNGKRGDIDIITNNKDILEKYLKKIKFLKVININLPYNYFFFLNNNYKYIMLDVDEKIRLGHKPYKPYFIDIQLSKLKTIYYKNVKILSDEDYIPLIFLIKVTSCKPNNESLEELKKIIKSSKEEGYLEDYIEQITNYKWAEIIKDIIKTKNWLYLQSKYKLIILRNIKKDYRLFFYEKFDYMLKKLYLIQKRILKEPAYRIRKKGYLIAFMGNDGAGKSSTIEFIKCIDYYKYTGVKVIYFGNNHYILPFLNKVMLNKHQNRMIRYILGFLEHYDKKLRTFKAKYYISKGYIVMADRYVYDELMGLEYNSKKTNNILKKIYRFLIKPKMILKPEITFFLDVDADVAYKRKQDYAYKIVEENIKRYREFLPKFDEVVKINANQSKEKVVDEIIKQINIKDTEINHIL